MQTSALAYYRFIILVLVVALSFSLYYTYTYKALTTEALGQSDRLYQINRDIMALWVGNLAESPK